MRRKERIYHDGEIRIINKFLWIPLYIQIDANNFEFRWLEKAKIRQKYIYGYRGFTWVNLKFIDKDEEK